MTDRLRAAATAVIREWDERGDGGCTKAVQDELREALGAPVCGNCGCTYSDGETHTFEMWGMCRISEEVTAPTASPGEGEAPAGVVGGVTEVSP